MTTKTRVADEQPEKLKQTPAPVQAEQNVDVPLVDDVPPASEADEQRVARATAHERDERTVAEHAEQVERDLLTPTGNTTYEPVAGSDGPRSQLELDQLNAG